ncbi:hypothetical protein A0H76_1597 [Hepatospora eriocheir]|uniref:Vps72/YL1 C-terminal domain-containing protein n=1 Tax=Hepatospora eriocheir TaxID=1081669 RepID=A0A1X0QGT6_9MICR|nr:hypothetical protein HERIO_2463 [Hepatospora eriocheir]ORD98988.1 hypothetical protein A0H76_1597 [Hepatospora eriocheir]
MTKEFNLTDLKFINDKKKIFKGIRLKKLNKELKYFNLSKISCEAPFKLCDVTGLKGNYTMPKTFLRYHDADIFLYIKELDQPILDWYLNFNFYERIFE